MVLDTDISENLYSTGDESTGNLEERMLITKIRATFDAKVRNFNEICWDICVDKAGSKLDQKTATCLSNCVDRFFDASRFIGQRFIQSLQSNGSRL